MKNIHILTTDNPSRLYLHSNNELQLRTNIIRTSEDYLGTNQNIYITSDEEIKEKRLRFIMDNREGMCGLIHQVSVVLDSKICPKIILTTDQDLIKDGVQAIDDNFLEWFVNNPSCERVKIERGKLQIDDDGQEYGFPDMSKYKIIIPQEESRQEYKYIGECKGNNDNGCFIDSPGYDCGCFKRIQQEEPKQLTDLEIAMKLEEIDREEYQQELHSCKYCGAETTQPDDECYMLRLKQETLEEASEKYSREVWGPYYDYIHPDIAITQTQGEISVKDFSRGAKWQAKRMYSEEEVLEIIRQYALEEHLITSSKPDIWLKQFKKK